MAAILAAEHQSEAVITKRFNSGMQTLEDRFKHIDLCIDDLNDQLSLVATEVAAASAKVSVFQWPDFKQEVHHIVRPGTADCSYR